MVADFEEAHEAWLQSHLDRRVGERKTRLTRKRYGETLFLRKVWWPMFQSFERLHPEYEVLDWRGRPYYADFVWLPGTAKLAFEVKGYGPHVTEMDRKGYCEELNRETFLLGLGYRVISIPHDDVENRSEVIQSLLRMVLSRFQAVGTTVKTRESWMEKEIILLAISKTGVVRPLDVEKYLTVNHRTAVRELKRLCDRGWFRAVRTCLGGSRVTQYELIRREFGEYECW